EPCADGAMLRVQHQAETGHRNHHCVPGTDLAELLRSPNSRKQHSRDQLIRSTHCSSWAEIELGSGDLPGAVYRSQLNRCAKRQQWDVAFPGWGGRTEIPADRSSITNLWGS